MKKKKPCASETGGEAKLQDSKQRQCFGMEGYLEFAYLIVGVKIYLVHCANLEMYVPF